MTLYMPLFRSCSNSRTLLKLHAHLIVTGLHHERPASTKLIESYAKLGPLNSAKLVFDTFPKPDSFMYGVLIKCYVWGGFFGEAICLYYNMLFKLTEISCYIFPSILRACSGFGDLGIGRKVHGRVIKCGLEADSVVQTSLLSMYGETLCSGYARKVFDEMPVRDVVSWSSIITSHVNDGQASEGLKLFSEMLSQGIEPDSVTLLSIAEACGELSLSREAKSVHGYVVRNEIESDGSLDNSLITMYGKCGDLYSAEGLFDRIVHRSTYSWTAMISSYNQNGCYQEAVDIFHEMQECNVEFSAITMMAVLCSCARLSWLKGGKSIHGFVVRKCVDPGNDVLGSALIDLYANCGKLRECHEIFHMTRQRSIVSRNMLISGYAQEGMLEEALMLFSQMQEESISPDSFTLSSVLSACGNGGFLKLGTQIHSHITKTGLLSEFVENSLIDMYSKCGYVDSAYTIFEESLQRSVVTWNSMICGFSQNGNSLKTITLFDKMYLGQLDMDEVTFLSAIQACSNVGYLEKGRWVHHKLIVYGVANDIYIDTALVDMYGKCGDLKMAKGIFDHMLEANVVSWSAMIGVYGMHGHVDTAIATFNSMIRLGIQPNQITFMNILSACAHVGYVEEGKIYFSSMWRDFGVEPQLEHYACLIDILSRAGNLEEGYRITKAMPFPPDNSIWGSLLNGCRIHKRMDMIEKIQENLVNMDDTGYRTLFSNIFAEGGEWEGFHSARSVMESTGLRKLQIKRLDAEINDERCRKKREDAMSPTTEVLSSTSCVYKSKEIAAYQREIVLGI